MQRKSIWTSMGLHVAVIAAAVVGLPWVKRDFEIPKPLTVELVDISPVAQTDKFALTPQKEDPEKKEPEKEQPPAPPKPSPAAKNTSEAAVQPVKKEEPKKEEKPAPPAEEEPDDALPPKKEEKKKEPEKKPEKKEEKKQPPKKVEKDFSSVLRNLDDREPAQKQPEQKAQPDMNLDELLNQMRGGQNAALGDKMTMSEEDALRRQLERCWNVPFGAKDAENLVVEIIMHINPDRSLREARVVDKARYSGDSFFRAAADSALRAVKSPLCSPFNLPPDKYDVWKVTTVTFNPKDMF